MTYLPFNYDIVDWVIGCSLNKIVESNSVDKKFLDIARIHIVEADGIKKELISSINISNIIVLYNFRELKPLPRINKYDDGKIHFMFFSRITPLKGVADIMSAVLILNTNGYVDKYCIDFYGDIETEYKREFDKCISDNENLRFCETIQLNEWSNYDILARYHYMLFPTYWPGEGFPGAIIDSYIAGVPVIASDWMYVPEFIEDGKTGRIISTHDINALVSVMKETIDGRIDCMEMSRNCQRKAYVFDSKNVLSPQVIKEIMLG
jgi:glycosyltransferase involved in cell wall biosynthesis